MAISNRLTAIVTADTRLFQRGMRRVATASARTAKMSKLHFAQLQNDLDKTAMAASMTSAIIAVVFTAAIVKLTSAIKKLSSASIDAAKKYESLGLAFRFSAREGENAADQFNKLVKLADRTPFETDKLIRYSIQLKNVTDGAFGTAEQIENMTGALAKAQLLGKDQTFVNSLGQIINSFQIGGGRLKLYVRTLQSTGAITIKTAKAIMDLSKNGGTATQVIKMLTGEFRKLKMEAYLFSQTAEGLESTQKSIKDLTLARLGGFGLLENYKLILQEINGLMVGIRDTDAFATLGQQLGDLSASLLELIKQDEFKSFLLDLLKITEAMARVAQGGVILADLALKAKNFLPGTVWGPSHSSVWMASQEAKELAKLEAGRERWYAEAAERTANNTGVTANGIDPEKQLSGER